MRIITNKFKTKCAATLRVIMPGEKILLSNGKAYSIHSKEFKQFQEQESEAIATKQYVEAQENAYFDRFCSFNNI
jgi:hypothetical protein